MLLKAKPSLRVINVARGGIVDETELAEAIKSGVIAGAALDVFNKEPTTQSPLFGLDGVVVTPHLGASTREAQDKAGDDIADMINLALAGDFVPYAVNTASRTPWSIVCFDGWFSAWTTRSHCHGRNRWL
jgi:D-3-phosphoglycerate dehydrogenase